MQKEGNRMSSDTPNSATTDPRAMNREEGKHQRTELHEMITEKTKKLSELR